MGFQHAVFGAEVTLAKAAVTDDSLSELLAVFRAAAGLARRHGRRVWWRPEECGGVVRRSALGLRLVDVEAGRKLVGEQKRGIGGGLEVGRRVVRAWYEGGM